ncbi:MAG TPA: TetR/AcrR family transcriptional regulator [Dehalococcoidia bacterium]|nr:TetR/AcrR family transcriptional regulator [Dehalococcoidia bacterium]
MSQKDGQGARTRKSEGDRRSEILEATVRRVARDGIQGATISKIAQDVGVSTALIMFYFPSKKDLITSALSYAMNQTGRKRRSQDQTAPAKGIRWLESILRTIHLNRDENTLPRAFWLEYWAEATRMHELRQHHAARFADVRELYASHIKEAIEEGAIRSDVDPLLAADLLKAVEYGLAVETTVDTESISAERALEVAMLALSLLGPTKQSQAESGPRALSEANSAQADWVDRIVSRE